MRLSRIVILHDGQIHWLHVISAPI
jgi:hypothetical protein